jgi:hypothetical protein
LELAYVSISGWMDEKNVAHITVEYYPLIKRKKSCNLQLT